MAEPAEKTATWSRGRPDRQRSPLVDIDRHVSFRIRQRRIMLGLTTAQMAELIAVRPSQVQRYETGTRIAAGRLYWIAQALGVDVGYFYEGIEPVSRLYQGINPRAHKPTAPVQFVRKLQEIWRLDREELAKLLGLEEADDIGDLLRGTRTLETRDAKDRIRHLIRIREALHSLFLNFDAECDWLREPRPELQGQSPLAMMLEGSMENLLTVSQFVQWMAGR
jgi:transcriptional regulator with XRE-family HTH domain